MSHTIVLLLGVIIGAIGSGISVYFLLDARQRRVNAQKRHRYEEEIEIQPSLEEARTKEIDFDVRAALGMADIEAQTSDVTADLKAREARIAELEAKVTADLNARTARITELEAEVTADLDAKRARIAEFEAKVISYEELQGENTILKRDLRNMDVSLRKMHLDFQKQQQVQGTLDEKTNDLGSRYLKESVKWISSTLTPNNFGRQKERLQKVIEACRGIGFEIPPEQEANLLSDLKDEFEKAVRAAFERGEQARIKRQIREEKKLEKEIKRELRQLERERKAIERAIEIVLAETKDAHSAEIERLRARLAEAEEKSQRAMSRAQMTKAGHVYVISNIGSFGENVYKVGLTRRLKPVARIKELGDASVPFPFDIHMMISSDDAPALENAIHRSLHTLRVNKMNPRKEFFRTDISTIHELVQKNHGEVEYVADAEALEYRQSLEMSEEDQEYIESVYDELEDDGDSYVDEG